MMMKRLIICLSALTLQLGTMATEDARADPLYDNGPLGGVNAYGIYSPYEVTDSFSLASASNLTQVQVGLWVPAPETATSLDWSIGSAPFGAELGSGTAAISTNAFQFTDSGGFYDVYESTFPLSALLGAGTYYLTLRNAVASNGSHVYWDLNNGASSAQRYLGFGSHALGDGSLANGSESFQIYGDTAASPVPVPGNLTLLGLGLVGFAPMALRRRVLPAEIAAD